MDNECKICNYKTKYHTNLLRHFKTKRHIDTIQLATCQNCKKQFNRKYECIRHQKTCKIDSSADISSLKDKINLLSIEKLTEKIEYLQNMVNMKDEHLQNMVNMKDDHYKQIKDICLDQIEKKDRQLETKDKQIEMGNKNVAKSISAIKYLTLNYPDAPSIKKMTIEEIKKITRYNDLEYKLVTNYIKKTLGQFIGSMILDHIEKDPKLRTVWTSDVTRNKYHVKKLNWVGDNNGIIVSEHFIFPLFKFLKEKINVYIEKIQHELKYSETGSELLKNYEIVGALYDLDKCLTIRNLKMDEVPLKQDLIKQTLNYLSPHLKLEM